MKATMPQPEIMTRKGKPASVLAWGTLGIFLVTAWPGMALIITTNCADPGASLAQPKRMQSGCASLGLPIFSTVGDLDSSGGFLVSLYHDSPGSGEKRYHGIGRTDANGAFRWKIAATNATHWPNDWDADQFVVYQVRDLGAGPVPCFGLYSDASGFPAPIFELQVPIGVLTQLENGTFISALNSTNDAVVLIAISSVGQLLWVRELSSPLLPVGSGFIWLNPISSTDFLLGINGTMNVAGTNLSRTLVARIDSDGVIQWSRKLDFPGEFPSASSSGPPTPAGEFLITVGDIELGTPGQINYYSTMFKISGSGSLVWGRKFVGNGGFGLPQDDGSILTQLFITEYSPTLSQHETFVVLDAAGTATSAVQMDAPSFITVAGVSHAAGKVYYYASYSTNSPSGPYTGVIGSSSLTLTNFIWHRYEPNDLSVTGGNLFPLDDGRFAYFATDETRTWTDLILLDSNFTAQADCELFSPISFPTVTPTLDVQSVTPSFEPFTFQVTNLSFTLAPADLVFETLALNETSLCDALPAAPSIQFSFSADQMVVSWPTSAAGFNLRFTAGLPAPSWTNVSPAPVIDGDRYVSTNPVTGGSKFFQLQKP